MLREPRKDEQPNEPRPQSREKPRRFRIVKLEERIAPGGGKGNGSNASCGGGYSCNNGHCPKYHK